jgi:arabinogalactan oligomer / maltooligosaccharide transport system substrate-binding protein
MSLLKKLGVSSVVALAAVSLAACGSKKMLISQLRVVSL